MFNKKRKLKNFLINPKYQFKYIFWISLTGFILIFVNAYVFYSYISENYAILVDLSPMTDEAKAQLYKELYEILIKLGVFSFLFLVCVFFMGIILSHRTAGPLFHFRSVFNKIKDGDLSARIHLRPKDDFRDVAHDFNAMMDSVCKKIEK